MTDLRIPSVSRGAEIQICVNGKTYTAYKGETVHAALLAAGYRVLRNSPKAHKPRGIFCGMGICYDCLVTIDGTPNQRACMTNVEDRMEVEIDEV
jgi:D-hydroxyproline dehydrogenase subunit gamma